MKTFECKQCGKEKKWSYSSKNIYCSNACQKTAQTKERVRQWLEEGKDWKTNIPGWCKDHLAEQRGYACEVCGINEHNGKPINLEVDHIDGMPYNNNISNLRFICPNCHSQTETYKAKNKGNGRKAMLV